MTAHRHLQARRSRDSYYTPAHVDSVKSLSRAPDYKDTNASSSLPVHTPHLSLSAERSRTDRLLQVGDEDADDQRVDVDVVHAALRRLGGGLYGFVDGLFPGAVGGAVVRVVGEALGHLVLAGGGAPGHRQQARLVQPGQRAEKTV